jgi:hypothetical protein
MRRRRFLSEVLGGELNPVLFEHRDKHGNLISRGVVYNTRTNAGRDWQSDVMGTLSTQPAVSKWVGLTATNVTIAGTETTLSGEIGSGTLARAIYTAYNHSAGTATYNQTKTFTSDQTVTLRTAGEFNAASSGTMPFIANISPEAPTVSGDTLALTWVKNI